MMTGMRVLCALGCLISRSAAMADVGLDSASDRIAVRFEASSSRLLPEDAALLVQFVAKAGMTSRAKLTLLVPATIDPVRARFLAARVAELERYIRPLAQAAEVHKVQGDVGGDIMWLAIIPSPNPPTPPEKAPPVAWEAPSSIKADLPSRPVEPQPASSLSAADLQLTDWVIRGVKHPAHGPTYAYVAKVGSSEAPREIVEQQIDQVLGLVKNITQRPTGSWVVQTEIGWIGMAFGGSPEAGGQ